MPTLTHIFNNIEYTIGYIYYHGDGTSEDPEDLDIIQIWDQNENPVSLELFNRISHHFFVGELIKGDRRIGFVASEVK